MKHVNPKPKTLKRAAKYRFLILVFPVFLLLLGPIFSGCKKSPSDNIEYSIGIDRSGSSRINAMDSSDKVYAYLIRALNISGNEFTNKGIKINLFRVGNSARPVITTVTLPPSNGWIFSNTNKRKKETAQFKKKLKATIEEVMNVEANQSTSQIYHALCFQLHALKSSTFSTDKRLILLSDGLESSELANFVSYIDKIKQFKESFPDLRKKMAENCTLPDDLSDITIQMFNSPGLGATEIVLACDTYWSELVAAHNGKISIFPNLPQ